MRAPRTTRLGGALVAAVALASLDAAGAPPPEPLPDQVALAYLVAEVAHDPANLAARSKLVRAYVALGLVDDAERSLAPALAGSGGRSPEALALAVDVAVARWRAAAPGTPARAAAGRAAIDRLSGALAANQAPDALRRLAPAARELSRPDLAAAADGRLAVLDRRGCKGWEEAAAADLLAAGEQARAAEALARAYGCTTDPAGAKEVGLRTIAAHLGAARGAAALAFAHRLVDRFPDDMQVLREAQRVALSQRDAAAVRAFGAKIVAAGPGEAAVLAEQVEVQLGAGDTARALAVAERLARLQPENAAVHLQAARIAGWAGQQDAALRHWSWLARRGSPPEATERALQVARALGDERAVADLLRLEAGRGSLAPSSIGELESTVERSEGERAAIRSLREQAARAPALREAWERLARAQERHGDLAEALATTGELARRFGASPALSLRAATLMRRLGRSREALGELARWTAAPGTDAAYWREIGDLAWDLEDGGLARQAYAKLLELGLIDALGSERLLVVERERGRHAEAIRAGRDGWERAHEPRLLLLAMQEAADSGRWSDLRTLADAASASESGFESSPGYWLLRGRLEEREGRPRDAATSYQLALAFDPASSAARAALLWFYAATGDRARLVECLESWAADSPRDPQLLAALTAGLERLGRSREALALRERLARSDPSDFRLASGLADALERSGDLAGADSVRAWVRSRTGGDPRSPAVDLAPPPAPVRTWRRRVGVEASLDALGPLTVGRMGAAGEETAGAWTLAFGAGGALLSWGGPPRGVPDVVEADAALRARLAIDESRAEVAAGASLGEGGSALTAGLVLSRRFAAPLVARVEGALNEAAGESAAMRRDALRSRVSAAIELSAGGPFSAGMAVTGRRWATRAGETLGQGGLATGELGYAVAAAYGDLRVRLAGDYQRNAVRSSASSLPIAALVGSDASALLPDRFWALGAGLGVERVQVGPLRLSADVWAGAIGPPVRASYRARLAAAVWSLGKTDLSLSVHAGDDAWNQGEAYGAGLILGRGF